MSSENEYTFREITDADYKKAELDLLRDALRRSYTERFAMMMKLMKAGIMMSKAKIVHKQNLPKAIRVQ